MNAWRRALLVVAALAAAAGARAQAPVVDLPTRPGVTVRMLVLRPVLPPTSVVILMTGGAGRIGIYDNGSLRAGGNFLVRSRDLFQQRGHAVLVPDVPSDRASALLNGDFRDSAEHAADLAAAIAYARQQFNVPVWVVGTSRGTHSAALAATVLPAGTGPDGVVLTSSILVRGGPRAPVTARPVQELDWSRTTLPVLVVHHARDACQVTPASRVPELMGRLDRSRSALLTFDGGRTEGPDCEAFAYHGFNGIEDQVVGDISAWIGGRR